MAKKAPLTHLAIIMDGNRRWAKARDLPTLEGHRRGYETFRAIARHCLKLGIKILTIYAFSAENWRRSEKEVAYLMGLLKKIESHISEFLADGIKVHFIGARAKIPLPVLAAMDRTIQATAGGVKGILNIAINYGGRDEIVRAVQKLMSLTPVNMVTETTISDALDTAGQPEPDLIIRTSGEQRLSGFLTWQSVYSELYFSPKPWPDFTTADLDAALKDYTKRQRRFGGSSKEASRAS